LVANADRELLPVTANDYSKQRTLSPTPWKCQW